MHVTEPFVSSMLPQLAVATLMVFVTVLVHGVGVTTLARLLRFDPTAEEHHHHFTPHVVMLVLAIVDLVRSHDPWVGDQSPAPSISVVHCTYCYA